MQAKKVHFYFDFGSPTSYLAYTQLPDLCAKANAELEFHPVLLGGIHKASGNQSPAFVPAKGKWMQQDMQRFALRYGVPLAHNPHFPINTLRLMRGATGTQMRDHTLFMRYLAAVFRAMWVDQRDMAQPEVVAEVLSAAGLDVLDIAEVIEDAAVKEKLKNDTEASVQLGLFGAPTMFFNDTMYFGQDRLDFLREDLLAA